MAKTTEMANAVIYARYSSHSQTEQSIEGQLRVCYEFAEREGIKIVGEYIDRAITGKYDDRPQFQKMIADSKRQQFKYVIVYKLDRFARNRYDSAIYKHKLKANNVKVLSAMEQISDSPEGVILEAVLEASAEYYSLELSQKVKRGLRESAIKGTFGGGHTLLGYKVIDKKVLIDEDKAELVRHIFREYAKGTSKREIVNQLSAKGYKNSNGKPLRLTSFQYNLTNKKYIGEYHFNGEVYENAYPAIIDKDTFEAVQAKLTKRSHSPASLKARQEYLLQGKAFCGYCSSRMVGDAGTSKLGGKYYYYSCAKKKKEHTCNKKTEKKDFLEWYVVEQTLEYVLEPKRMDFIAERVVALYDKEFNDDNVKAVENKVAKLDKELGKIADTYVDTPPALRAKLNERATLIESQMNDAKIDLAKLKIANGIRYTKDHVKAWLTIFTKGDLMDMEFRKRIIDVLVNAVYVYDDKIIIYFNLKDSKLVSFIDVQDDLDSPDSWESTPNAPKGIKKDGASVRISTPSPRQMNLRLNSRQIFYIFVNGIAGIVFNTEILEVKKSRYISRKREIKMVIFVSKTKKDSSFLMDCCLFRVFFYHK